MGREQNRRLAATQLVLTLLIHQTQATLDDSIRDRLTGLSE